MEQAGAHWGGFLIAANHQCYSGALSINVAAAGRAGQYRVQQIGARLRRPLSPTIFGLFFGALLDHLHSCALAAGAQLRYGEWVSTLVHADDAVLLSWPSSGLQLLMESMNHLCLGLGPVDEIQPESDHCPFMLTVGMRAMKPHDSGHAQQGQSSVLMPAAP